ncbi:MAG: CHASE2 domain-containing protein [Bacteroidota bacterium]
MTFKYIGKVIFALLTSGVFLLAIKATNPELNRLPASFSLFALKGWYNNPVTDNGIVIVEPSFEDTTFLSDLILLLGRAQTVGVDFVLTNTQLTQLAQSANNSSGSLVIQYSLFLDHPKDIIFLDSLTSITPNYTAGYVDLEPSMGIMLRSNNRAHFVSKVTGLEPAHSGQVFINIRNDLDDYEMISLDTASSQMLSMLDDKVVLYGDVLYGDDFFMTPKGKLPGVVLLANAIQNMRDEDFITRNYWADAIFVFFLILVSLSGSPKQVTVFFIVAILISAAVLWSINVILHLEWILTCSLVCVVVGRILFKSKQATA